MHFASVTRDELWIVTEGHARLFTSRVIAGQAWQHGREIVARDGRDPALADACEAISATLRESLTCFDDSSVRLVAGARRAAGREVHSATIAVAHRGISIVTTPEHVNEDYELLVQVASAGAVDSTADQLSDLPVVWRHGSAAVLLHEASGHPAERGSGAVAWPGWLTVRDEPDEFDDSGKLGAAADLLAGEAPSSIRRESFSDVPLRRMSKVIARQQSAPFELPERRIEVHLVAGGGFDPVSDSVTLRIAAADVVDGTTIRRIP